MLKIAACASELLKIAEFSKDFFVFSRTHFRNISHPRGWFCLDDAFTVVIPNQDTHDEAYETRVAEKKAERSETNQVQTLQMLSAGDGRVQ